MILYPDLTHELISLLEACQAYNDAPSEEHALNLSQTAQAARTALNADKENATRRKHYQSKENAIISLSHPDFSEAISLLVDAFDVREESVENSRIDENALQYASQALALDKRSRMSRNRYYGSHKAVQIIYQHLYSSLAVFGSHNLPNVMQVQLSIYQFLQTWGSTALGLGGIGGASVTDAYTTAIIHPQGNVCVYFGNRFAYYIERPNPEFYHDLTVKKQLVDKRRKDIYNENT